MNEILNIERHRLDSKTENNLNQLGDMVLFIENLMEECLNQVDGKVPNEVLIPILIHRHLLQKADSIHANIDVGAEDASKAIMRTLIENYIYLAYILHSKTDEKSKAYYLAWYKSLKAELQKFQSDHKKSPIINSFLGGELDHLFPGESVQAEIDWIDKKIKAPWLKEINKKWNKVQRKANQSYINWHALFGHPKIRHVAVSVGMEAEYETLYSIYSQETHSTNAMRLLEHRDGISYFKPLRAYEDPDTIISMASTYLWRATDLTLRKLFPEKQSAFHLYSINKQGRLHDEE